MFLTIIDRSIIDKTTSVSKINQLHNVIYPFNNIIEHRFRSLKNSNDCKLTKLKIEMKDIQQQIQQQKKSGMITSIW
jgi:hypothetical protein